MREKILRRHALFFLVILLVQDFAQAKYIERPNQLQLKEERKKRDNSVSEAPKSRQRRIVTVLLLGLVLFATSATITAEVLLAIKGCCLPNNNICKYNDEFQKIKGELHATNKRIDDAWVASQVKFHWIEQTNVRCERMWNEVKRINQAVEDIIAALDVAYMTKLEQTNNLLLAAVQSGNTTVRNYNEQQLDSSYPTYFTGDWKFITGRIAGYLFVGGSFAFTLSRRRARYAAMADFAQRSGDMLPRIYNNPKALSRLGGGDPRALLNEAVTANRLATNTRTTFQRIRGAGANLLNVGLVGLEIWMTIEKFKACDQRETVAKQSLDKIKEDRTRINQIESDVVKYRTNISAVYQQYIKDQLIQPGVLKYMADIKNLITQASKSPKLAAAKSWINTYLNQIVSASEENTYNLVNNVTATLKDVIFTVECLRNKAETIKVIRLRCKEGTGQKTLKQIYDTVVYEKNTNSGPCTTLDKLPFTSFADVSKTIEDYSKVDNFYFTCRMNSQSLRDTMCKEKCDGYTEVQIGNRNGFTVPQVQTLLPLCGECPIPPNDAKSICNLKLAGFTDKQCHGIFPQYTFKQVETAYNKC